MLRDTDEDWKGIAGEPFYGVFSDPSWFRAQITPERFEEFWATGRTEIDGALGKLRMLFGDFSPKTAIDFGCGVGRLTRAIGRHVERAVGIDVAPGMLDEARRWGEPHLEFRTGFPDEMVDWINSIIVFQHIHPANGFPLLQGLLDRLKPGGGLTLQLTLYKDATALRMATDGIHAASWDGEKIVPLIETPHGSGTMMMYDYDFNRVMAMLHAAGVDRVFLEHTNHGGAHGVFILGRKNA